LERSAIKQVELRRMEDFRKEGLGEGDLVHEGLEDLQYTNSCARRLPLERASEDFNKQLEDALIKIQAKIRSHRPINNKSFSKSGDINGFLAISAHYKVSSNLSAIMGIKHFPEMSEFDSLSSVFLGFKLNLNFSPTHYGN
jgi:hypothetical protein